MSTILSDILRIAFGRIICLTEQAHSHYNIKAEL